MNPSHVFSAPGIYTVTVSLFNSFNNLIETINEIVEVKDPARRLLYNYPQNASFCSGGYLNLQLSAVNGIFNWYQRLPNGTIINSTISDTIRISSPGTYYVEMRQNDCNGCIMLDSINVSVLPRPNFNLGPDRNLCPGDSVQLTINVANARYLWNTGDTTSSIWVRNGGLYWGQAEYNNNGCPFRDSIIITLLPPVLFALPPDTTLCTLQTLLLDPGVPNASYLWQDGSTSPTYTVSQAGTYWVRITNSNNCSGSDTIVVSYANAQLINLGGDSTLCEGDSLLLSVNVPNAQYLWSTGATSNQIIVYQSGIYWVRVDNGSCTIADTINLQFEQAPSFNLGNDTTLCAYTAWLLTPGIQNASYRWQDGSTQSSFTVTQPGSYWVEVTRYSCIVRDTINVSYYPSLFLSLGNDTSFCSGNSVILDAGPGYTQYLWNTGAQSQQIVVSNQGTYSVVATDTSGCSAVDTLIINNIYSLPLVNLGSDGNLCAGENRTLNAGTDFQFYLWSTGVTSQTIQVNSPGLYFVTVEDNNGCIGSDTVAITGINPSPAGFLPGDSSICRYSSLILIPKYSYRTYYWSTGQGSSSIEIKDPGLYWLEVRDAMNCNGRDTIIVIQKNCLTGVYVPTAFSPNNDGNNDLLTPLVFGSVIKYRFTLYDRGGQVVFSSTKPGQGWNGRIAGLIQTTAVFVWVCEYELVNEKPKVQKGTVVLIQ